MPEKGETIKKAIVEPVKHPIGTILLRKFGGRIHRGKITKYDEARKYYWINYDNGDLEELNHKQTSKFKSDDTNTDPIRRITRNSHRQNRANIIQENGKNLNSKENGKYSNSHGVRKKLCRLEKLKLSLDVQTHHHKIKTHHQQRKYQRMKTQYRCHPILQWQYSTKQQGR